MTQAIRNPGDLNADDVVDRRDLDLLIVRVGTLAQGASDHYDLDYDGRITVMDVRIAVTFCTKLLCQL